MGSKYTGDELFYRLDMLADQVGSKIVLSRKSGFSIDALMKAQQRGFITARMANRIIKGTGCNRAWLLYGKGNMFDHAKANIIKCDFERGHAKNHAEEAIRHVLMIDGIPEGEKTLVVNMIQCLVRRVNYEEENSRRDTDNS